MNEQKPNAAAQPIPTIEAAPPSDKLVAVAATLRRNLESIPIKDWQEPIEAALQSAFMLGRADALRSGEVGEDRALERGATAEDAGYDFIAVMARHFGDISAKTGFAPSDLTFRWMAFKTAEGETLLGLLPVAPIALAEKLAKKTL